MTPLLKIVTDKYLLNSNDVKIQSIIAGMTQFEAYKDNPEYIQMLEIEQQYYSLYAQRQFLINDKEDLLEKMKKSNDTAQKNRIREVVSDHENRIMELNQIMSKQKYVLDTLRSKFM